MNSMSSGGGCPCVVANTASVGAMCACNCKPHFTGFDCGTATTAVSSCDQVIDLKGLCGTSMGPMGDLATCCSPPNCFSWFLTGGMCPPNKTVTSDTAFLPNPSVTVCCLPERPGQDSIGCSGFMPPGMGGTGAMCAPGTFPNMLAGTVAVGHPLDETLILDYAVNCGLSACTAAQCCKPTPQCLFFAVSGGCGDGMHPVVEKLSTPCATANCTVAECCTSGNMCGFYECSIPMHEVPGSAFATVCTGNCTDAQCKCGQTCSNYACTQAAGKAPLGVRPSKSGIFSIGNQKGAFICNGNCDNAQCECAPNWCGNSPLCYTTGLSGDFGKVDNTCASLDGCSAPSCAAATCTSAECCGAPGPIICNPPVLVGNFDVAATNCATPVASGGSCTVQCNAGYVKSGDLKCTDGLWSAVTCNAATASDCTTQPAAVTNAVTGTCSGTANGGTCTLTCQTGFTKSADFVCTTAAWSAPTCTKTCCNDKSSGMIVAPTALALVSAFFL